MSLIYHVVDGVKLSTAMSKAETRTSLRTKVDLHINDDQAGVLGRKIAIVRPRIRGFDILIRHGRTQHTRRALSFFSC
jgi:hypothetical protein